MQDKARLFAYTTWVIMISLAIIVFTSSFLVYISDPGWLGLIALLSFGLIYLNFSFMAVKRYVRKVFEETSLHFLIALLIYLPPAVWIYFISEEIEGARFLTLLVIAFACGLGAIYGYRSGRRQQAAFIKGLKEKQEKSEIDQAQNNGK